MQTVPDTHVVAVPRNDRSIGFTDCAGTHGRSTPYHRLKGNPINTSSGIQRQVDIHCPHSGLWAYARRAATHKPKRCENRILALSRPSTRAVSYLYRVRGDSGPPESHLYRIRLNFGFSCGST